jgi:hypothetical protein
MMLSPASCSLGMAELVQPPHQPWSVPSRQLLSRCFRAWRHLAQRQRAVAAAVTLSRRQPLRKGLQALRWALWIQEAQLEVAWGRHRKALLTRSFREVRGLHVESVPGSGGRLNLPKQDPLATGGPS